VISALPGPASRALWSSEKTGAKQENRGQIQRDNNDILRTRGGFLGIAFMKNLLLAF
jgi:hypothetical protein